MLSDSEKRGIYDRYGEEGLKQHAAQGGRGGGGMNIQDIFSSYVPLPINMLFNHDQISQLVDC